MVPAYPLQAGADAETAIAVARALAFGSIGVAASVLVYYLTVYVREILVPPYEDRWWYLAVGVAAAVVYGVAGLVELATALPAGGTFRIGATLFFFLFSAVGVRALYATVKLDHGRFGTLPTPSLPGWTWYAVIGAFVVAWWGTYLLGPPGAVAVVETVGLAGAATYTLAFAVLTVRDAEGTSVAAVVRQFVPRSSRLPSSSSPNRPASTPRSRRGSSSPSNSSARCSSARSCSRRRSRSASRAARSTGCTTGRPGAGRTWTDPGSGDAFRPRPVAGPVALRPRFRGSHASGACSLRRPADPLYRR